VRDVTSLGQAIVDPTRVRIIAALRRGELCVCELVDALEISQSTLSGHLQVLRQTGLVITRKDGRWIYYSLTDRKTALIEVLFSHIQAAGDGDPRLRRDSRRIERRLAIRENGRCVLGVHGTGKTSSRSEITDVSNPRHYRKFAAPSRASCP
jgi:ArsR family transcriptional regulator, arsenate/arsenite/antimonite-responsive transcriptional repressor